MSDNVKITDLTPQVLRQINGQLELALAESAIHAEGCCTIRCPVDTGHLRGSINWKTHKNGHDEPGGIIGSPLAGDAVIGTNVEYGPHVEYGTKFQKPQPFMRPGIEDAISGIRMIFAMRLGEAGFKE